MPFLRNSFVLLCDQVFSAHYGFDIFVLLQAAYLDFVLFLTWWTARSIVGQFACKCCLNISNILLSYSLFVSLQSGFKFETRIQFLRYSIAVIIGLPHTTKSAILSCFTLLYFYSLTKFFQTVISSYSN